MPAWGTNRSRRLRLVWPFVLGILALHPVPTASALRVCMLPADLPFPENDERRADLETRLKARFDRANVDVVGEAEVAPILEQVDDRSGAIFDRATGRVDASKRAAYEADLERSFREQLDCRYFARLSVHQVLARYYDDRARWDGMLVTINSGPRRFFQALGRGTIIFLGIVGGVLIIPGNEEGWVPALSLSLHLTELAGGDVAYRSAGIEPLMSLSISRGKDLLPEDRWLRDSAQIEKALDFALGDDLLLLRKEGRPSGSWAAEIDWR